LVQHQYANEELPFESDSRVLLQGANPLQSDIFVPSLLCLFSFLLAPLIQKIKEKELRKKWDFRNRVMVEAIVLTIKMKCI
jgi:hypothetical protein